MATLEKRIETLERAVTTSLPVIFLHFVGFSGERNEIQSVRGHGGYWERMPGETEEALKERVRREAEPNPHGGLVFQCN